MLLSHQFFFSLGTHWASPNPCPQWALLHPTQELGFSSFCTRCQPGINPRGILCFVLSLQCCGFPSSCWRISHFPSLRQLFCSVNISCALLAEEPRGPDTAQGHQEGQGCSHTFSWLIQGENSQADLGRAPLKPSLLVNYSGAKELLPARSLGTSGPAQLEYSLPT